MLAPLEGPVGTPIAPSTLLPREKVPEGADEGIGSAIASGRGRGSAGPRTLIRPFGTFSRREQVRIRG